MFHNSPGEGQKDAPEYVELVADVRSPAASERKNITYALFGGEVPDKLQLLRKFPTRREAHDYYRNVFDIDADGYFMFWYQGSIADFANISDAARFQRVAEMFKLDDIQREWLAARVEMKRAEEEFEEAKNIALNRKRRLHELEKFKNALEQRDIQRRQGLLLLTVGLKALCALAGQEEEQARQKLQVIVEEYATLAANQDKLERLLKVKQDELDSKESEQSDLQEWSKGLNSSLQQLTGQLKQWREQREGLQKKVAAIEEKMKHIHRSRAELLREKGQLENAIATLEQALREHRERLQALTDQQSQLNRDIGALSSQRRTGEEKLRQLRVADEELADAASLKQRVAEKEARHNELVLREGALRESVQTGEQELKRLEMQQTSFTRAGAGAGNLPPGGY